MGGFGVEIPTSSPFDKLRANGKIKIMDGFRFKPSTSSTLRQAQGERQGVPKNRKTITKHNPAFQRQAVFTQ
ncbi:hypothetical protein [Moraxella caviae]|uniref:hypothetical protein n=1 Tax=Moraxella caviae TaxID=34060 RepID=UPI0013EFA992|nr:hypothetical protein [Moraxella caviae]